MTDDAGRYMRSNCTLFLFYQLQFLLAGPGRVRNGTMAVHKKRFEWYCGDRTGDRVFDRPCTAHSSAQGGAIQTTGPRIQYVSAYPGPRPSIFPHPTLGNTLELEPSSDAFSSQLCRRLVQYCMKQSAIVERHKEIL